MKLYHISQTENNSYDTFDSAVVCAESEEQAKMINPEADEIRTKEQWENTWNTWASSPDKVTVEYIGEAKEGSEIGVVCASFNAG